MASLVTNILTEFALQRDLSITHGTAVEDLWLSLNEKTQEQHHAMKQIVKNQKSLAKKLQSLHASLEETSNKITQGVIEQQQAQANLQENCPPQDNFQQFYEAPVEGVPHPIEVNIVEPTPENLAYYNSFQGVAPPQEYSNPPTEAVLESTETITVDPTTPQEAFAQEE